MANADVTRSHPVKQVKDSMQQDENGIPVNEIAQNKKKLFDSNISPTPSP